MENHSVSSIESDGCGKLNKSLGVHRSSILSVHVRQFDSRINSRVCPKHVTSLWIDFNRCRFSKIAVNQRHLHSAIETDDGDCAQIPVPLGVVQEPRHPINGYCRRLYYSNASIYHRSRFACRVVQTRRPDFAHFWPRPIDHLRLRVVIDAVRAYIGNSQYRFDRIGCRRGKIHALNFSVFGEEKKLRRT